MDHRTDQNGRLLGINGNENTVPYSPKMEQPL